MFNIKFTYFRLFIFLILFFLAIIIFDIIYKLFLFLHYINVLNSKTPQLQINTDIVIPEIDITTHHPYYIPPIIHQTYKTNDIPANWQGAYYSWQQLTHHHYQYILWTDEMIQHFLILHYPWFLETWLSYAYPIERVDAFRYFILFHYGGIYVDLDIICKPLCNLFLDEMRSKNRVLLHRTKPLGISNDFMLSEPHSAYFSTVIQRLKEHHSNFYFPFFSIFCSTSGIMLSHVYDDFVLQNTVSIIDYNTTNFHHIRGNSWHMWDMSFLLFIYKIWKHYPLFIFFSFVLLIFSIYLLYKIWKKTPRNHLIDI